LINSVRFSLVVDVPELYHAVIVQFIMASRGHGISTCVKAALHIVSLSLN